MPFKLQAVRKLWPLVGLWQNRYGGAAAVQECLNVINYDAPVHSTTYVHRAGRTARAGRAGQVFSLLRLEEMRHFNSILRKIDNAFVKDFAIKEERLKTLKPAFDIAVRSVRDEVISHK